LRVNAEVRLQAADLVAYRRRSITATPGDAAIKAIVDAIQTAFDTYSKRRENFGPHFKHEHGKPFTVGGHKDHIHLSVN
jgi:hypothetical protein